MALFHLWSGSSHQQTSVTKPPYKTFRGGGGLTFSPFNDDRGHFRYLQLPTFPNQSTTNQLDSLKHPNDQELGFCWCCFDQILSSFFVVCFGQNFINLKKDRQAKSCDKNAIQ